MSKITFYHGTTTALPIKNILQPPIITTVKREEFRKKDVDKVFFSNSLASAIRYAKKAAQKYGGKPVVYQVNPIGQYYRTIPTEFAANKARIVATINI